MAVAWFTNKTLFKVLLEKAKQGVTVQLLASNDEINRHNGVDFQQLNFGNSAAYLIGNGESDLMHNKFCVIDSRVVITGSYNWSYKAERNHENIVITTDDFQLCDQFIAQFKLLRDRYVSHKETQDFPVDKIIKRLEILKNYVMLEDEEDITRESRKLATYQFQQEIAEIITALNQHQFNQAVNLIELFICKHHQVAIYNDVDISALKLEIRHLEHQLNAYDDEKTEIEKLLNLFQHRHSKELGSHISRLLHLRKLKFKAVNNAEKFAEAEQDEREYNQQLEQENQKHIFELREEEKRQLKRNYKKASILCHPDKVNDEMKEMATETFNRLKQAYEENDLAEVNRILAELEQGNFFKARSETLTEKEKLKIAIQKLKVKIQQLETEIIALKESEEYQTVADIENWDDYFAETKSQLITEIEIIEGELAEG